jgi:glutamate-1-semialdehyde 2,1-aminomutase
VLPRASSAGVPRAVVGATRSVPFNNLVALRTTLRRYARRVAAVIVEPLPANMGLVLPQPGFLEELRALTAANDILLIFDEVISGFRLCYGGAQTLLRVTPDLTILGKIIGGGLPVGAFGGRADIMARLAPEGDVYQAGTLSGNPLAMAAGYAALQALRRNRDVYPAMAQRVALFADAWRRQTPWPITHLGSMFSIFFRATVPRDFADARAQDVAAFRAQYRRWLQQGVYLPPALCETAFISTAHTADDLMRLLRGAGRHGGSR